MSTILERVKENLKDIKHDVVYALDLMFLWRNHKKYGSLEMFYNKGKIIDIVKHEKEKVFDDDGKEC